MASEIVGSTGQVEVETVGESTSGKYDLPPDLLNAKVKFGLAAQGHVPTIRKMLADGATWDEIGAAIGWCSKTAREHWQRHCQQVQKVKQVGDERHSN